MNEKPGVLLVEDEESIREGLRDVLLYHGYDVTAVGSGEEGIDRALGGDFAVVVLDVMLPGVNGFEVCRRVRQERPAQAILMLTAKGSEEDVVEGFRSGADDYVTKPFSVRELLARVEALLRRSGALGAIDSVMTFGEWKIETAKLMASRDGQQLEITPRELSLIRLLRREKGRIVSRRTLLKEVWGMGRVEELETRTVDMHIAKLRKKLDLDGELIQTVRGAGYRYRG
jgi:two-component system response regulator RegX3